MEFFSMNIDSPYNAILGRNWLREIRQWPLHSTKSCMICPVFLQRSSATSFISA
ncbi:hypothetical protein LguiA_017896 [Lonicera macranthoides]